MIYGETYLTKYDWIIQLYILTNKDTEKHIFNILDKINIDNKYKWAILNKFINFFRYKKQKNNILPNFFTGIFITNDYLGPSYINLNNPKYIEIELTELTNIENK